MSDTIDWSIINRIVNPEHQYREVLDPPLDEVRMAWPFKTEEELKIMSKWFKEESKRIKQKQIKEAGESIL
jgi:hypothetical protein